MSFASRHGTGRMAYWALAGVGIVACQKSPVTVAGQVFIVTQGRENIKLALVEVALIPDTSVRRHLAALREVGAQQQVPLKPTLDSLTLAAQRADSELRVQVNASLAGPTSLKQGMRFLAASERASDAQEAHRAFAAKYEAYNSPEYYLDKLPQATSMAKTDADGKFAMSVPPGRYVVLATTTRSVAKGLERYDWLVNVDASSAVPSLLLSNDNLMGTKCADCVLLPSN